MSKLTIDRRKFLKVSASLMALMSTPLAFSSMAGDKWGAVLPRRRLGKTGLDVTMLALGSQPALVNLDTYPEILETALEGGCRFFETARAYSKGKMEGVYGTFLEPYRKEIVLMTKTYAQDSESYWRDLEASLNALKTDHLDIQLMHAVDSAENIDSRLSNGVFDAMMKAKEEGIIRHAGFSGHSNTDSHNYLISRKLPGIEVVLLPVNVADPLHRSFIINTIPLALEQDLGIIAMKTFADGGLLGKSISWGRDNGQEREAAVPDKMSLEQVQHFVYSLPVASATVGFHKPEQVTEVIGNLKSYSGMTEKERMQLTDSLKDMALNYTLEPYKDA